MATRRHIHTVVVNLFTTYAFIATLSVSYNLDIVQHWGYYGFEKNTSGVNLIATVVSVAILIVSLNNKDKITQFFMLMYIYFVMCPMVVLFTFGGLSWSHFLVTTFSAVIILMLSQLRFKTIKYDIFKFPHIFTLPFLVTTLAIFFAILSVGYRNINLNIYEVYLFRSHAAEALPNIMQYLIPIVLKSFIPVGLSLCLIRSNYFGIVLYIVFSVLIFAYTHHKLPLVIAPIIILFHYALLKYDVAKTFSIFIIILSGITLAELIIMYMLKLSELGSGPFSAIVVRRAFFLPALIDSTYINYFSENGYYYWSNSKVTLGLLESPYQYQAPAMIGYEMFGTYESWTNTGLIGSGFANFGYIGVLIYSVILGSTLAVLSSYGKRLGVTFIITSSFFLIQSAISSSDLLTVFFTHGLIIYLLTLIFVTRRKIFA